MQLQGCREEPQLDLAVDHLRIRPPADSSTLAAMTRRNKGPSTARLRGILASAAEVLIVEAGPDELDRADAARIVVTGDEIAGLARVLAVVDGGRRDRCLCLGWPTMVVSGADGREVARWTVHHQAYLRGFGDIDVELRDGPALTEWLAEHGLHGSRDVQLMLARQAVEHEARRVRWVTAAPAGLASLAEAVTRRDADAERQLAKLLARRIPDLVERIRTLTAWAGLPARENGGTFWYEFLPQQLLLAESTEAILGALMTAPLSPAQLDGAAELFTSFEWTRPLRAEVPESLRSQLITHVTATGTEPMRFRMRHGYGAAAGG
jgi:hypothetical protein